MKKGVTRLVNSSADTKLYGTTRDLTAEKKAVGFASISGRDIHQKMNAVSNKGNICIMTWGLLAGSPFQSERSASPAMTARVKSVVGGTEFLCMRWWVEKGNAKDD